MLGRYSLRVGEEPSYRLHLVLILGSRKTQETAANQVIILVFPTFVRVVQRAAVLHEQQVEV